MTREEAAQICKAKVPKSVKQKCRNLYSETAETCTLRCDYCGKYTKESEITLTWTMNPDRYLMCRKCADREVTNCDNTKRPEEDENE